MFAAEVSVDDADDEREAVVEWVLVEVSKVSQVREEGDGKSEVEGRQLWEIGTCDTAVKVTGS